LLSQNWEQGLKCAGCQEEIAIGEEIAYGRHAACARKPSSAPSDPVEAAEAALAAGGRVAIPKAQLRALALLACERAAVPPVRRPDRGVRGARWYARCSGWTAARVEAGLSMPEVAGMWLDILDAGRTPPVSHADLRKLLEAAGASIH
jgi:hypothetical protein